jgi:acyl-CoA synthetase (AMP-forming)/AMP-acid ligase II
MSFSQDFRTLLFDLIDDRYLEHEHAEWSRVRKAVTDGWISRTELLEALDWTVWRFSAVLTSKLHDNMMANLKSVEELITGPGQRWMSFHHEWAWMLLNLPDLVANIETLRNENLLLGIRELVGDKRAAKVGLIRFTEEFSKARNGRPA